jgi:hypothetical protein
LQEIVEAGDQPALEAAGFALASAIVSSGTAASN